MAERPRYGVDGYRYVIGLLGGGSALVLGGSWVALACAGRARLAGVGAGLTGVVALVPGLLGLRYVVSGKLTHRDRLLDAVEWVGDETVLDVGCGAGLLAIGAGHRVPRGRVIASDIWVSRDLSGNGPARTRRNAELEGVADRVEVRTEDARSLTLPDGSVDVVVSALCLHNISGVVERERAVSEIARVLAPGGTVVISDLSGVEDYRRWLSVRGFEGLVERAAAGTFPPQRVVIGRKRRS